MFAKPDSPQLRRVVMSLAKRGHELTVVYRGPGEVPGARYVSFEIPAADWRHPWRWERRRWRYLQGFLHDHDVVSIQFLHSWGFTPELMGSGCFTVRPWGSDVCPPPGGPQPSAETVGRRREMLRCATAVSATCDSFAHCVARFAGLAAERVQRTPLGVDLEEFSPTKAPLAGPPIVGFLKGFGHAYGAQHLVRAIPRIVAEHPGVCFELVGEGPLLPDCRRLADSLGVAGSIRWLPRLAPRAVRATLAGWTLSVIPSVCESFGISALESSAMRLPVVASAVGGLAETVVDGETGVLIPPEDVNALATAINGLLDDPARRHALGEAGRAFVAQHYAWEACMDTWERFFVNAREAGKPAGALAGLA